MKRKQAQLSFENLDKKGSDAFGGTLMKKAKGRTFRPLESKRPIHLVMRSSVAKSDWSMRYISNKSKIDGLVQKIARRYSVRLLEYSNNGNHLHLLIRISNRRAYQSFIRVLTAAIALKITGASKIKKLKRRFWDFRPFSRIVRGYRGYKIARDYVVLNALEAMGMIPYQPQRLKAQSNGSLARVFN